MDHRAVARLCVSIGAPAVAALLGQLSDARAAAALRELLDALVTRDGELEHEAIDSVAAYVGRPAGPAFRWQPGERDRVSLLPIRHSDVWAFRKTIEGLHWTPQEVDLTRDKKDWDERLTADERRFVRLQLAFFARVDIDVLENLDSNFSQEVDCLEAAMVYAAQMDQECTHAESYGLQIEAVMAGAERAETLDAVRNFPVVARMRDWALRWTDRGTDVGERLVAWAFIEGVQFQGPFCALQWLRLKNLLPGVTEYNTFIIRDEGVHTLFTCLLVRKYLARRPDYRRVREIFASGMENVDLLVSESLPVRLIGMNAELMKEHVRHQADRVLVEMGYAPMYNTPTPFAFMDALSLNEVAKVNFFEARPSQYQNVTAAGAARLALDDTPVDD